MCQITDAHPVEVRGMGVRLSNEISSDMYNYGHLQVLFEDGSVGWYEAGWGPMISENAFFIKDVMSPNGSVSIVLDGAAKSDDIEAHTKTSTIRIHSADLDDNGEFSTPDQLLKMDDEPGHQELCDREQAFVLKAIRENLDLRAHMHDAVKSLSVVLAADASIKTGQSQVIGK
jgi:predicted dehydrogenase